MFTFIGIINTAATVVYRFVSNNTPAISSVIAIQGNMYSEAPNAPIRSIADCAISSNGI